MSYPGSFVIAFFLMVFLSSLSLVFGHITFSPREALPNANTYFTANIPHGCGLNGTNRVVAVFPTYITSILMERIPFFDASASFGVDPVDGLQHWRAEWVSNGPALPHDQLQRLGFQIKTPALDALPPNSNKKMVMPLYQYCEGNQQSNWTITVTIIDASAAATTTPPPSSTTTAAAAAITTTDAPHIHSSTTDAHASEWTSSDKVSVASLVICTIMFISTLVLFHNASFKKNPHNGSNAPSDTKSRAEGQPGGKDIELEEKRCANNEIINVTVQA